MKDYEGLYKMACLLSDNEWIMDDCERALERRNRVKKDPIDSFSDKELIEYIMEG